MVIKKIAILFAFTLLHSHISYAEIIPFLSENFKKEKEMTQFTPISYTPTGPGDVCNASSTFQANNVKQTKEGATLSLSKTNKYFYNQDRNCGDIIPDTLVEALNSTLQLQDAPLDKEKVSGRLYVGAKIVSKAFHVGEDTKMKVTLKMRAAANPRGSMAFYIMDTREGITAEADCPEIHPPHHFRDPDDLRKYTTTIMTNFHHEVHKPKPYAERKMTYNGRLDNKVVKTEMVIDNANNSFTCTSFVEGQEVGSITHTLPSALFTPSNTLKIVTSSTVLPWYNKAILQSVATAQIIKEINNGTRQDFKILKKFTRPPILRSDITGYNLNAQQTESLKSMTILSIQTEHLSGVLPKLKE